MNETTNNNFFNLDFWRINSEPKENIYEFLVLVYEDATRYPIGSVDTDKVQHCTIWTSPMRSYKLDVIMIETAKLFYWNEKDGYYVTSPKYTIKNGVAKINPSDNWKKLREELSLGVEFNTKEAQNIFNIMNKVNPHYNFYEVGYINEFDEIRADKSLCGISVYYMNNTFHLGKCQIRHISVESNFKLGKIWEQLRNTIKIGKWEKEQLLDLVCEIDAYDARLYIDYTATNGNGGKLRIIFNDHCIIRISYKDFDEFPSTNPSREELDQIFTDVFYKDC